MRSSQAERCGPEPSGASPRPWSSTISRATRTTKAAGSTRPGSTASTTGSNGSTVGYLEAPFAEQIIVHDVNQSMPLDYNNVNSPFYSEAEREFAPAQDWTAGGVDTLVLYVRGQAHQRPGAAVRHGRGLRQEDRRRGASGRRSRDRRRSGSSGRSRSASSPPPA